MELYARLEQILGALRPAFSREAAFRWFVLFVWGVLLNTQPPAVTSYLNALGLGEVYYGQALHWFESGAFSVEGLCAYLHSFGTQLHQLRHPLSPL